MSRAQARGSLLVVAIAALVLAGCASATGAGSTQSQSAAQPVALTVQADVVYGSKNVPKDQAASQVCVSASRFPHNSEIVWRTRVIDPVTGKDMDDSALQSVQVKLGDGQTFDMHYAAHPKDNPADYFWTVSFDIPEDYPSGTLSYQVTATAADGRTGSFKPFQVAPSLLTITDETVPVISSGS